MFLIKFILASLHIKRNGVNNAKFVPRDIVEVIADSLVKFGNSLQVCVETEKCLSSCGRLILLSVCI